MTEVLMVGEAVAGQAAKTRKKLEALVKNMDKNTFDLADLLYEVREKGFYKPEFNTFAEYVKSIGLKKSKAYYLSSIKECMVTCGIPRETYEPVGIYKLRDIASLDPNAQWQGSPMKDYIIGLVENAKDKTQEQVAEFVRTLKGQTGEDEVVWVNLPVKRIVRDKVLRPALELAKARLGSSYRDKDGNAVEPSDANALEVLAVEFLNDPANSAELLGGNDEVAKEQNNTGG